MAHFTMRLNLMPLCINRCGVALPTSLIHIIEQTARRADFGHSTGEEVSTESTSSPAVVDILDVAISRFLRKTDSAAVCDVILPCHRANKMLLLSSRPTNEFSDTATKWVVSTPKMSSDLLQMLRLMIQPHRSVIHLYINQLIHDVHFAASTNIRG